MTNRQYPPPGSEPGGSQLSRGGVRRCTHNGGALAMGLGGWRYTRPMCGARRPRRVRFTLAHRDSATALPTSVDLFFSSRKYA